MPAPRFRRFRQDEQGSMTVEFAIVVPLLMFWFVGSFVWFQAYRNYSQAEKASFAIADIVSRQTEVDDDFIDELQPLFTRLQPRAGAGHWLRVSSISFDEDEGFAVEWSRNANGGDDLTTEALPASILPAMSDGDTVILAETYVPYQPMVGWAGIPPLTWANRVVIRPRYVTAIAKTD